MKTKLHNRILSAILAFLMFLGCLPMQVAYAEAEPEIAAEAPAKTPVEVESAQDILRIIRDGEETSHLDLLPYERIEICVEGADADAEYQWQILHIDRDNVWVNIYDAKSESLHVTMALVGNMLREDDTTQLRCRVISDGKTLISAPLTVQLCQEEHVADPVPEETISEVTEEVTEATEEVTEATEEVTEATEEVTEATEEVTEATEEVTEATEEVTEATEEVTEATEEVTEATEEVTEEPAAVTVEETETTEEVFVRSPKTSAGIMLLAEGDEEVSEFVTITIDYRLYAYQEDGDKLEKKEMGEAFTSYVATLKSSEEVFDAEPVQSPTIVGYTPYLVNRDANGNLIGEMVPATTVDIDQSSLLSDVNYRVEYHPTKVKYKVQYFFQNIYDDLYVEDASIHAPVDAEGETGYTPNLDYVQARIDGFTSLYYEPETIAADGSTVFYVFYERNYYLMEFDCAGGYGTDTIYVRYGMYISVPSPVRSGWDFDGWDLTETGEVPAPPLGEDADGDGRKDGDGTENDLPATMPCYNSAYKALWTHSDTTFTVIYWVENADDDGYSYAYSIEDVNGKTGDVVTSDNLTNYSVSTDLPLNAKVDADVKRHIELNLSKSEQVTLEGDGSSVFNIYYDRKEYSLKFYYAMSSGEGDSIQYYVVGGSTYGFGASASSTIDRGDEIELLDQYMGNGGWYQRRGSAAEKPVLNSIGNGRNYIKNQDTSTVGRITYTYYYIAFTEKYGADISNLWPCGVFDPVQMEDGYYVWGTEGKAMVSAWNGEHHVEYTQANSGTYDNQTIKGNYEKLDETLLWRYNVANAYADTTDNDINKDGVQDATAGTVAYLCFWENGANPNWVDWSIPELYIYNIWVECIDQDNPPNDSWVYNGKHYYLKSTYYTCDDSSIKQQTVPSISGYTYTNHSIWSAIFIGSQSSYDDETTFKGNGVYYNIEEKKVWIGDWATEASLLAFRKMDENDNSSYLLYDNKQYSDSDPESQYNRYVYDPDNPGEIIDHNLYREAYSREFFFNRSSYTLELDNYGSLVPDENNKLAVNASVLEVDVKIGEVSTPLANFVPSYPGTLEPGAYEFGGWYTGPKGTGLKVVLDETKGINKKDTANGIWYNPTMPADNLLLFAYWEPVNHNVYFYYDFQDYQDYLYYQEHPDETPEKDNYFWYHTVDGKQHPESYPIVVGHGSLLGTTYSNEPKADDNRYTFVGWFYLDEDNKKRFAPDSMEIKRDLHLFAEWQSSIDTQYNLTYVLDKPVTIGDTSYPAGTDIAALTTGHLTAGRTKTFNAKVGTELLPIFQSLPLFPSVNSHSILMDEDKSDNEFTFRYVTDAQVYYRVRYINKITGEPLYPDKVDTSTHAIITEKFVPIEGFLPEKFYIRKVLASDGDDGTEEDIVTYNNEIIFFYTPDTEHGVYVIEYYTEKLDYGDNPTHDEKWTLDQSVQGIMDLKDNDGNATVITETVNANKFTGFSYSRAEILTFTDDGTPNTPVSTTSTTISGTLDVNGLAIRVYYTRNPYPYRIRFIEYGTSNLLGYGQLDADGNILTNTDGTQVFTVPGNWSAKYGSSITYTAPSSIQKNDGVNNIEYLFYGTKEKPQKQTEEIGVSEKTGQTLTGNILTFYYQAKQVQIYYKAVCLQAGAVDPGAVTLGNERAATLANISGSTALVGDGFEFKGWFIDENCTTPVNSAWVTGTTLKPGSLDTSKDDVTYYALFEPVKENLIIKQDSNLGTDTFLFRITGKDMMSNDVNITVSIQGAGSVAIKGLYCGTYKVEELTNWSWTYTCTGDAVKTVTLTTQDKDAANKDIIITDYEVSFANSPREEDWLNGESEANENIFNNITP